MSELQLQTIELPLNGLDTDTPALLMQPGYSPSLTNVLLHNGVIQVRGPIESHSDMALTNAIIAGAWYYGDSALIGHVNFDATAIREPWQSYFRQATAAQLATPNTAGKLVNLNGSTVTAVSFVGNAAKVPGGRGARLGAYVYGFGYGTSGAPVGNPISDPGTYFLQKREFLRWDGTTTLPTTYTNAPTTGQDVVTYLNRIWCLGGVPPGGGAYEPNALYFSDQAGPTADTTAMWQDDATGLVNKIIVDSTDSNDAGVGLARLGQTLVVFKRHSLHVLSGYSASTFNLRTFSQDIGCVDQRSIVEFESTIYFMSERGYYRFDGTTLTRVSNNLDNSLMSAANYASGAQARDGGFVIATKLSNDYILLTEGALTISSGARQSSPSIPGLDRFCALFHIPSNTWVKVFFGIGSTSNPGFVGCTPTNIPWVYDLTNIYKISNIISPEAVTTTALGFDALAGGGTPQIQANWTSRTFTTADFGKQAQFHRLLMDYHYTAGGGSTPAVVGWTATLTNNATTLDTEALPLTTTYPAHAVYDVFTEARDYTFNLSTPGGSGKNAVYQQFLGAAMELQVTRQRRGS